MLFLFGLLPMLSKAQDCAGLFKSIVETRLRQIENGVLTEEHQRRIGKVFSDSSLSSEEALKQVHEIFLEAQVQNLLEPIKTQIKQIASEPKYYQAQPDAGFFRRAMMDYNTNGLTDGSLSGIYDLENERVEIWTTDKYKDAAFTRGMQTHENEHSITYQLAKEAGISIRDIVKIQHSAEWAAIEFIDEKKSMIMEWEWLHAIPSEMREEIALELERDKGVHPSQKGHFLESLRSASMDLDSYLQIQYNKSRYSEEAVQRTARIRKYRRLAPPVVGSALGLFFIGRWIFKKCQEHPEGEMWNLICSKLRFFPVSGG